MSANEMPVRKGGKQGKKGRQKGTKMKTFTRPRQGATYDLAKILLKPLARAAAYETRGDSALAVKQRVGRGGEGKRRGVASSSSCCFGACKLLAMNRLNRMNRMNSIQLNRAPHGVWVSDWVRVRTRVVASLMRKFMMMIMTTAMMMMMTTMPTKFYCEWNWIQLLKIECDGDDDDGDGDWGSVASEAQ